MTRRRDGQLNRFERVFQWMGGALFVGALAFCGYTFLITWSQTPLMPWSQTPPIVGSRALAFNGPAVLVDAVLFSAFAAHHSVFARDVVKARLARAMPDGLLRSAYVWTASLLLIVACAAWQPIGGELYRIQGWRALLHAGIQVAGVLIIASAVRSIDALELAGIRPHSARESLQIVGPYGWVRHPLYLGWLLATFGPAHMTGDRLFFAGISAFYLVVAVPFEERSLIASFGEQYTRYQRQVRWRMLPYVY